MDGQELQLSERHRTIVDRFVAACRADERVIGAPQPAREHEDTEQAVAAARTALGEEAWMAAYVAGHALTPEQAIIEALDEAG